MRCIVQRKPCTAIHSISSRRRSDRHPVSQILRCIRWLTRTRHARSARDLSSRSCQPRKHLLFQFRSAKRVQLTCYPALGCRQSGVNRRSIRSHFGAILLGRIQRQRGFVSTQAHIQLGDRELPPPYVAALLSVVSQVCNAVPMFKDMHQQDSLELLCVLLDSIRTEEIGESYLVSLRRPSCCCVIYLSFSQFFFFVNSGMSQSCLLKRNPNFIDDVFGGLTRSVVVCSRCCRPSVALERCMHTSVCFPTQLVDSLRPQRSNKSKNKTKAQNNKQGGKGKKGGKNNGKRNQAESDDEGAAAAPEEPAGHASPETSLVDRALKH